MTEAEKIQIEQEVEDGSCEFMHVHEEIVEKVEGVMPDEQQLLDLSGWNLTETEEFAGNSHEKITQERYVRG